MFKQSVGLLPVLGLRGKAAVPNAPPQHALQHVEAKPLPRSSKLGTAPENEITHMESENPPQICEKVQ